MKIIGTIRTIFLIVVITLLLLEILIQVFLAVVFGESREFLIPESSGNYRVVFLGDSNTYGQYYNAEESYPLVLNKILMGDGQDIEILNLGLPGNTSFAVLDSIDEVVAMTQPSEIFLMIGTNDSWVPYRTPNLDNKFSLAPGKIIEEYSEANFLSLPKNFLAHSGIIKLFGFLNPLLVNKAHGWRYGDAHINIFKSFNGSANFKLYENIISIKQRLNLAGIKLTVLTYPASKFFYNRANSELRKVSKQQQINLIDINRFFNQKCKQNCDQYFVYGSQLGKFPLSPFSDDQHPNRLGHQIIAEIIAEHWSNNPSLSIEDRD